MPEGCEGKASGRSAPVPCYQDKVVYYNSEGIDDPADIPDERYVRDMCEYLSNHGELYFIEVLEDGKFIAIGDVTLKAENLPIVIGVSRYRGVGIGTKVMRAILQRAKEIGITKIHGSTIYDYNIASRRLWLQMPRQKVTQGYTSSNCKGIGPVRKHFTHTL